ncbi:putative colanic acid biosynthesis acetyltransferase [Altererythrobacter sp. GH1-8]|uniref:putative colanic acid biosynthesis acetyltransferase n=1 Tax=Altererythrobacter sp. GH1-8 TaxID=3349333 RepID=UPI00374CAC78
MMRVQPDPSIANKVVRTLWQCAWLIFYRPSPTLAHGWRRFILRLFGANIGAGAHPYPSARIWAPWNLEMGPRSCLGPESNCYSAAQIILETDCVVSQGVHLCSASHDFRDPGFPLITGPIVIGRGAWVAAEAFIGPGVEIGPDAVVGARAVVTKNVASNTVVAGNPAREVGRR